MGKLSSNGGDRDRAHHSGNRTRSARAGHHICTTRHILCAVELCSADDLFSADVLCADDLFSADDLFRADVLCTDDLFRADDLPSADDLFSADDPTWSIGELLI